MPGLQLGAVDYVCLLEIPTMGIQLPVRSQWMPKELRNTPCRFWGSIHNGGCILGGSNREGQFDFFTRLEPGDPIIVTDMRGTVFRCRVERIDRTASADYPLLYDENYLLTIFVREQYDDRYIVVRCQWAY